PAVRKNDVDRLPGELAAQRPRAREQRTNSEVRTRRERRQLLDGTSVERAGERDHTVFTAEAVECTRELECDELGTAALASRHEVENPHDVIVPLPARAIPWVGEGCGGRRDPRAAHRDGRTARPGRRM